MKSNKQKRQLEPETVAKFKRRVAAYLRAVGKLYGVSCSQVYSGKDIKHILNVCALDVKENKLD